MARWVKDLNAAALAVAGSNSSPTYWVKGSSIAAAVASVKAMARIQSLSQALPYALVLPLKKEEREREKKKLFLIGKKKKKTWKKKWWQQEWIHVWLKSKRIWKTEVLETSHSLIYPALTLKFYPWKVSNGVSTKLWTSLQATTEINYHRGKHKIKSN